MIPCIFSRIDEIARRTLGWVRFFTCFGNNRLEVVNERVLQEGESEWAIESLESEDGEKMSACLLLWSHSLYIGLVAPLSVRSDCVARHRKGRLGVGGFVDGRVFIGSAYYSGRWLETLVAVGYRPLRAFSGRVHSLCVCTLENQRLCSVTVVTQTPRTRWRTRRS
jgi:hypothetical protein